MTRPIIFKAWDKTNNEWYMNGDPFDLNFSGRYGDFFFDNDHPCDMRDVKLIWCQFTGLTDKNGKEIYEGDLLRIPAADKYEETTFNCFEVFYHDNDCIGGQNIGFCMNRMHTQGHSGGGCGYKFTPNSIRDHGFIVIGNIYEHPELLQDN